MHNIWDALKRHEIRFEFNVAGMYMVVGGRTRLLRHSQARRLWDVMV